MSAGIPDLPGAEKRSASIDRKKVLLRWLQGRPKPDDTGTMENYMCLRGILGLAHWRYQDKQWSHAELGKNLPIIPAAIAEIDRQIRNDLKTHLEACGVRHHD